MLERASFRPFLRPPTDTVGKADDTKPVGECCRRLRRGVARAVIGTSTDLIALWTPSERRSVRRRDLPRVIHRSDLGDQPVGVEFEGAYAHKISVFRSGGPLEPASSGASDDVARGA